MTNERPGRVIKFRAWDGQKMSMPRSMHQNENGLWRDAPQPCTLTQFTGLTDKNGTKIYEGDIVQTGAHGIGVIEWDTEWTAFRGLHPKHTNRTIPERSWEVIGNIYENPELVS